MRKKNIKKTFDNLASRYDEFIEKVIPYYKDQNRIICSLIPFSKQAHFKVLDLGMGTGALSYLIAKNFKNATVHGIDLSDKMVRACQKRFCRLKKRHLFECGDIENIVLNKKYDVVLAGLSIHHLTDKKKQDLFKRIYGSISSKGLLIIRDLIKSESLKIDQRYLQLWCEFECQNGLDANMLSKTSQDQDIPTSMENHLKWLKRAGFKDVDCVWKYINFALFIACKSKTRL
jgi:tRNA (cmo5U34)-methyltransferase